jgi:hypothetical protein
MEDQDHSLRSAGRRPLTPGMSRQAVPNSNHCIRVGTDRDHRISAVRLTLQWTAALRNSPTTRRTRQFDPLLTFKVGPLNGREAPESGLRRTRKLRQCVVLWRRQSAKPPSLQPPRDVAAFLRTGAVSLSVVVSGERLNQAANCLQLLVFDHCHASGRRVSRVANRMP